MFKWIASYAKNSGKCFCATFGTSETSARMAALFCIFFYCIVFCSGGEYTDIYRILTFEVIAAGFDILWFSKCFLMIFNLPACPGVIKPSMANSSRGSFFFQHFQPLCEGGKAVALAGNDALPVGRSNTGNAKGFVDINAAAGLVQNF